MGLEFGTNALQVRPPDGDTSSSSVSLRRNFLGEYFSQVALIRDEQVGDRNGVVIVDVSVVAVVFLPFLLPRGGGPLEVVVLFRRRRGERHEEVNLAALELCVGRDDDDLGNDAVLGGGGGRLLEDVLGVCLHDVAGLDGAADFLDAAVGVHYADYVQGPAWENAGDATPDAVSHAFSQFS
ncbi:hypothetical protein GmHk_15G043149 [Glycine max]|nr:hypothetical protein GmHk_15G043149 [Glycine max]